MHRPTLGIAALLLLVVGGALWRFGAGNEAMQGWYAATVRAGLFGGALWLAWPQLEHVPRWLLIAGFLAVLVSLFVFFKNPRAVVILVLMIVVAAYVGSRTPGTARARRVR